jgi:VanZ family protein
LEQPAEGNGGSIDNRARKTLKPFLCRWLPVLFWAAVIFILSADSNPYSHIPNRLYSWLWWSKLFGRSLIFYLGGISHILEYAILSFLFAQALWQRERPTRGPFIKAIFLVLFYAFTDELHQYFIPGRAFQLVDLALDTLGALLGLGAYWLYLERLEGKQSRSTCALQGIRSRRKIGK